MYHISHTNPTIIPCLLVYIPSSVAEKLLGKGKLVDILAQNVQLCARFNGGANAGHTLTLDAKWGRGARVEGFPEKIGMVPTAPWGQNVKSKTNQNLEIQDGYGNGQTLLKA